MGADESDAVRAFTVEGHPNYLGAVTVNGGLFGTVVLTAAICKQCGALVNELAYDHHDEWHRELSALIYP